MPLEPQTLFQPFHIVQVKKLEAGSVAGYTRRLLKVGACMNAICGCIRNHGNTTTPASMLIHTCPTQCGVEAALYLYSTQASS